MLREDVSSSLKPNVPPTKITRAGFTMVEMLVAMAILITVISGVVLLYTGALRTVQKGYAAIDNFEIGRSVLAALERDIKRAFTAREFGQFYQFHGGPDAFMYVGVLENGDLGRVTYAVTRLDDSNDFVMHNTETLRTLLERALSQISLGEGIFPGQAAGFAQELGMLLARDGSITAGTLTQDEIMQYLPPALDAAIGVGLQRIQDDPDLEWNLPPLETTRTDGSVVSFEGAVVDVDVLVETAALVRFEEPGVTDLSSFSLPPNPDDPAPRQAGELYNPLRFPSIDAYDVNSERNYPDFIGGEVCPDIYGGNRIPVEGVSVAAQELLDCYTYRAMVMPDPVGTPADLDLRNLAKGTSIHTFGSPASYVTPPTIDRMFEASKRDVWLALFTGGNVARAVLNPAGTPQSSPLAYNFFDAWAFDDNLPGTEDEARARIGNDKDSSDYVVGERIVLRGRIVTRQDLTSGAYSPFFVLHFNGDIGTAVEPFDILGSGAYFTYAMKEGYFETHFNSLQDIPGYTTFSDSFAVNKNGQPLQGPERFAEFDEALGAEMRGSLTDKSFGSPLAPKLPKLVSPRFWIMSEGPTANDPPLKHYFDQVIEVPSSTGRSLPKQFVPDAG